MILRQRRPTVFYDVAAALTDLSGKEVAYTPVDIQTYRQEAERTGKPEFLTQMVINFMTDIKNGQEEKVSGDMEKAPRTKAFVVKRRIKKFCTTYKLENTKS